MVPARCSAPGRDRTPGRSGTSTPRAREGTFRRTSPTWEWAPARRMHVNVSLKADMTIIIVHGQGCLKLSTRCPRATSILARGTCKSIRPATQPPQGRLLQGAKCQTSSSWLVLPRTRGSDYWDVLREVQHNQIRVYANGSMSTETGIRRYDWGSSSEGLGGATIQPAELFVILKLLLWIVQNTRQANIPVIIFMDMRYRYDACSAYDIER